MVEHSHCLSSGILKLGDDRTIEIAGTAPLVDTLLDLGDQSAADDPLDLYCAHAPGGGEVPASIVNLRHVVAITPLLLHRMAWRHHPAVTASAADYDATKKRYIADGATLALEAEVAVGGRASYLDFGDRLAGMIELIELTDKVEQLFGHIRQANDGWLGDDPVRRLA